MQCYNGIVLHMLVARPFAPACRTNQAPSWQVGMYTYVSDDGAKPIQGHQEPRQLRDNWDELDTGILSRIF